MRPRVSRMVPTDPRRTRASLTNNRCLVTDIGWRLAPLDDPGLPGFIARGALPDPAAARCELCERRPNHALSTVLVVEGHEGLPVPFLICANCRRTLEQLHAMLESARRPPVE